jgi:threonine dehydrogenase-like Zn-dependent dehydrogenase
MGLVPTSAEFEDEPVKIPPLLNNGRTFAPFFNGLTRGALMKAVCWYGKSDVRVETVADPSILDARDIILKITSTAICGSDLHLYGGLMPTMEKGDVLGHEPMGEVVEVGSAVRKFKIGDRVVVPFTISCGECFFCRKGMFSLCDTSNPNATAARKVIGHSPAGLFGYSHMLGGFAGGQAEFLRVPFADVGPIKIPSGLPDDQVLFLSDIFPTGYMAAENCEIEEGDTVAVWGCGPVGQFAIRSAWMFGAERVIAIDRVPERLTMAASQGQADTINFSKEQVYDRLMEMTGGRGPDRCIDAVGTEAYVSGFDSIVDRVKVASYIGTDRPHVLREAIMCCRKGGTISIPGVYIGVLDKIPFGAAMNKGLTLKMGQTHVQKYLEPLLRKVEAGEIDPSFVITHKIALENAPAAYKTFRDKEDGCIKVVIRP